MWVELLIYVGPPFNGDFISRGDVIEIRSVGFEWGKEEIKRAILVKADLTQDEIDKLLEPDLEWVPDPSPEPGDLPGQLISRLLRYRKYGIDGTKLDSNFLTSFMNADKISWNTRDFTKVLLVDGEPLSSKGRQLVIKPLLKSELSELNR
jgi:hypothetical protein